MAKRRIFDELMEGVAAVKAHREGKIALRSYKASLAPRTEGGSKKGKQRKEVELKHPQGPLTTDSAGRD